MYAKKRKIDDENRTFNTSWENDYLFIINKQKKPQCLVCLSVIAVLKEYNLKRHYMTNHLSKYEKYIGDVRESVVIDLKRKLQSQQNVMIKATTSQQSSLLASYIISNEIAKSKKSLSNGEFVKNCAIKMPKSINENKIASEFEKISLSRRTVTRRIADIAIRKTLQTIMTNCAYFSIALDESTDVSDVSQLLIFVRVISPQFEVYEELLELFSLHGTTKGSDIFNVVKNAIEPFGGFKNVCVEETFLEFHEVVDQLASSLSELILQNIEKKGLSIAKCCGQGYDGAANMSDVNDAAKEITEMTIFFDVVQRVFVFFFGHSIVRWRILSDLIKESKSQNGLVIKKLNPTRWAGRYDAVFAFKVRFVEIQKGLTKVILCSSKVDEQNEAEGIKNQIENYYFICTLVFQYKILQIINLTSKILQSKSIDLDSASNLLKNCYE
ncbi:hypothetical protein QTP88_001966 [Uroleucon formosanum]